jgi:hypothetical protein
MCRLCSGLLQGQVLHLQPRCDAFCASHNIKNYSINHNLLQGCMVTSTHPVNTNDRDLRSRPARKAHERRPHCEILYVHGCIRTGTLTSKGDLRKRCMCCMQSTYMYCISRQTYTSGSQSNLPMETQAWMSFTWRIRVLAVPTTSSLGP